MAILDSFRPNLSQFSDYLLFSLTSRMMASVVLLFIRSGYNFLYCGLVAVLVTNLYYAGIMNNDIDGAFRRSNAGRVTLLNGGKWPFPNGPFVMINWLDKNYRRPIQADEEK
jgi:hypothetical protein